MDFISSLAKKATSQSSDEPKKAGEEVAPSTTDPKKAGEEAAPSTTELLASAKVLAEAVQGQFNKESGKPVDNKVVAEAAADVLDAAQRYGKLDSTQGAGQYIEKAETYLHQYGSANPAAEKPPAAVEKTPAVDTEEAKPPPAEEKGEPEKAPVSEEKKGEGFLKQQSGESKAEGEGGADYLKMAGDFLNKK